MPEKRPPGRVRYRLCQAASGITVGRYAYEGIIVGTEKGAVITGPLAPTAFLSSPGYEVHIIRHRSACCELEQIYVDPHQAGPRLSGDLVGNGNSGKILVRRMSVA